MYVAMHEPRTAVMISVEASWLDQSGTLQAVPARMEDKSSGGACIRVKTRIVVGSKLRIKWRWEQFAGIAKSCRSEGQEFLVGIQRDTTPSPILNRPVPAHVSLQEGVRKSDPEVSTAKIQSLPKRKESKPSEIPVAKRNVESVPIVLITGRATAMPPREVGHEIDSKDRSRISQPQDFDAPRWTELQTKQPQKGKERKHMRLKWLELAHRHNKQDGLSERGDGNSIVKGEKGNRAPQVAPPAEKTRAVPARESVANFQVELLPMEDIYRTAGIMNPRRGYSINKVVEMLHSEHIRGLSKEMKRAAVLMALDAAGIPIDGVLRDAKARQDALEFHEAEQRKQLEAEWARKTEENIQIQAELERIKTHYMARISRKLDGMTREKATFSSWLTMKQQESQSMSEAAELCLKSTVSEPASASLLEVSLVGASAKPV
jgi:hypothetical protein